MVLKSFQLALRRTCLDPQFSNLVFYDSATEIFSEKENFFGEKKKKTHDILIFCSVTCYDVTSFYSTLARNSKLGHKIFNTEQSLH